MLLVPICDSIKILFMPSTVSKVVVVSSKNVHILREFHKSKVAINTCVHQKWFYSTASKIK